jgi:hypothetical protein
MRKENCLSFFADLGDLTSDYDYLVHKVSANIGCSGRLIDIGGRSGDRDHCLGKTEGGDLQDVLSRAKW